MTPRPSRGKAPTNLLPLRRHKLPMSKVPAALIDHKAASTVPPLVQKWVEKIGEELDAGHAASVVRRVRRRHRNRQPGRSVRGGVRAPHHGRGRAGGKGRARVRRGQEEQEEAVVLETVVFFPSFYWLYSRDGRRKPAYPHDDPDEAHTPSGARPRVARSDVVDDARRTMRRGRGAPGDARARRASKRMSRGLVSAPPPFEEKRISFSLSALGARRDDPRVERGTTPIASTTTRGASTG